MWWLAIAVFVAGLAMTVGTLRMITEQRLNLESKGKTYLDLKQMETRLDLYNGAVEEFQKLSTKRIVSLREVLQKSFPGYNPNDMRESRKDSVSGWFVRESEIVLNGIKISQAMEFVASVEQLRPPWVLKRCAITASSGEDGTGNVILTLSGLSLTD